jgi:hypothetical protein
VTVLDTLPDVIESDCYWERLPDGRMVRRCASDEASGPGAAYCRYAETMGLEAGDILPTFVSPDDARKAIDETDAGYERMNIAILASMNAPPEFKASWGIQYATWKTFATGARATVGFLNTKAVMDQNDRYASQLQDWGKSFSLMGGQAPGPVPPTPGQGVPSETSLGGFLSGSTGLILAGAALAGILVFGRYAK